MKSELFAFFYGGPDQVMPLQTALAAGCAVLLLFWNKVTVLIGRVWNLISPRPVPAHSPNRSSPGLRNSSRQADSQK